MTQINPFVGSVVQTSGVQRTQASEKDRQLRRASDLQKNAGLASDRFEHAVESAEAVDTVHDEQKQDPKKKRPPNKKSRKPTDGQDDEPRLDLTA